jgi:hypothetical protein
MASYVPWYGKKRKRLKKREGGFAELLRNETKGLRVEDGAEAIRAAQVRVLKSRRAELAPSERNATEIAELDRAIDFWLTLSRDEIVAAYRAGTKPKPQ